MATPLPTNPVTIATITDAGIRELRDLAIGWQDTELLEHCRLALYCCVYSERGVCAGALNEARWHLENP